MCVVLCHRFLLIFHCPSASPLLLLARLVTHYTDVSVTRGVKRHNYLILLQPATLQPTLNPCTTDNTMTARMFRKTTKPQSTLNISCSFRCYHISRPWTQLFLTLIVVGPFLCGFFPIVVTAATASATSCHHETINFRKTMSRDCSLLKTEKQITIMTPTFLQRKPFSFSTTTTSRGLGFHHHFHHHTVVSILLRGGGNDDDDDDYDSGRRYHPHHEESASDDDHDDIHQHRYRSDNNSNSRRRRQQQPSTASSKRKKKGFLRKVTQTSLKLTTKAVTGAAKLSGKSAYYLLRPKHVERQEMIGLWRIDQQVGGLDDDDGGGDDIGLPVEASAVVEFTKEGDVILQNAATNQTFRSSFTFSKQKWPASAKIEFAARAFVVPSDNDNDDENNNNDASDGEKPPPPPPPPPLYFYRGYVHRKVADASVIKIKGKIYRIQKTGWRGNTVKHVLIGTFEARKRLQLIEEDNEEAGWSDDDEEWENDQEYEERESNHGDDYDDETENDAYDDEF